MEAAGEQEAEAAAAAADVMAGSWNVLAVEATVTVAAVAEEEMTAGWSRVCC